LCHRLDLHQYWPSTALPLELGSWRHLHRINPLPAWRVPWRTGRQWAASAFHRPSVSLSYSRGLPPAIGQAGADRAPTDEERIAPLVAAQGCWGGVIERRFEVHESVCGDGRIYHLEFDASLQVDHEPIGSLAPQARAHCAQPSSTEEGGTVQPVKTSGRLDLGHVSLRTEAPHAQRPRRGAYRTGASAPWGVFGRPSGNARRLLRERRFRSRCSTKGHWSLTGIRLSRGAVTCATRRSPRPFRLSLLKNRSAKFRRMEVWVSPGATLPSGRISVPCSSFAR
jgi:hypothetical protein